MFDLKRCAMLVVALALPLAGQESRGTIGGEVFDPAGAAVVGAQVTVTEIHTGTKIQATSDDKGQYMAPFLLPGDYDVSVRMDGFHEFVRKDVHLGSGEHPVIDVRLTVGDVAQSVEVTEDVPLVNTENASAGQSITTKEVEELPLNGRTPMMLAQLAIGVIATARRTPPGTGAWPTVRRRIRCRKSASRHSTPTPRSGTPAAARSTR